MKTKVASMLICGVWLATQAIAAPAQAQDISFNRQIRPLLADICFNCHGPDTAANEGSLRLDELQHAILEGDSGAPAIVPGNSKESELVRRLRSEDDPMPPADFQKQLTPEQIETVAKWIDQGAKYEGHWAFQKPTRPELPETTNHDWPRIPLDQFILHKLESNGLIPSPEADKSTLLRRLSLDLTGLPPTPGELKAFLGDTSPVAYERQVDRLLMSPHYGERMAIPWLDYARYADSNGFQSDGSRDIWAWRDWVINAYNRNLTFDQFTIEQLAGDMLPNPSRAQVVATGFNRNHRLNGEGGRIVDEWFVETVIDRVETTGLTWLGLTFNCCRCHDHKYDPISQKEFYQMFAFFNSNQESGVLAPAGKNGENTPPLLALTTPTTDAKVTEFKQLIAAAESNLGLLNRDQFKLVETWADSIELDSTEESIWQPVDPTQIKSQKGIKFQQLDDGSYLVSGKNPATAIYDIELPLPTAPFTGLMLEAFPDASLPHEFLGRSASNGNFVLSEIRVSISQPGQKNEQQVTFQRAEADFEQPNWTAQSVLRNKPLTSLEKPSTGWATLGYQPKNGAPNRIMFVADEPVEIERGSIAIIHLVHQSPYAGHAIGRFRLQVTDSPLAKISLGSQTLPPDIIEIVKTERTERSPEQVHALTQHYLTQVSNPFKAPDASIKKRKAELKDYEDRLTTTMVMREGKRRDAFVLERGEYDQVREKVERKLPAFLPPMKEGLSMDRLGLAKWIVDPSNPLTARVWVNRQWETFFGVGIVKTTENFGTQADFPVHPQLLDWLAVEFMEGTQLPDVDGEPAKRWDMKAFTKMLVTSATYRQSSHLTPELLKIDPDNRLLARGPRFRLTGELIRDQALAVSGLLKTKIGGP
ncbi:MAG: mono/diheme cytochrome c family protein, partial [Mariniblastus sp.]